MAQLCLHGKWDNGGTITWMRSAPLEEEPGEAADLMACYERGNGLAQSGGLAQAVALFERGLEAFQSRPEPTSQERVAEAALLWGLGTALDRSREDAQGYRTLLRILSPGRQRDQIPLGLVLNWVHSTVLAGHRHGHFLETASLLDALQRLGWGTTLRGEEEAAEAARQRYQLLFPFRARGFEGLMQEQRFEDAARLAEQAVGTLRRCDPDDERRLSFWSMLLELAQRRTPDFRLADLQDEAPDEARGEPEPPSISVRWSGDRLEWRLGQSPGDPHTSSLARLYQAAAMANDRGDLSAALQGYQQGLAAWGQLTHPRPADALLRAMLVWGKGCLEDRLSEADPDGFPPEQAWSTLSSLADPGVGTALPLPLLLSWVQSSVIVATHREKWSEAQTLLAFLIEMALHPELGSANEEIRSELSSRFLYLLEGVYAGLEAEPDTAADWVLALQRKVEPEGLVLLPLRDLLFHSLTGAGRHRKAELVASEVLAWARQEGDRETEREWEEKARQASKAAR